MYDGSKTIITSSFRYKSIDTTHLAKKTGKSEQNVTTWHKSHRLHLQNPESCSCFYHSLVELRYVWWPGKHERAPVQAESEQTKILSCLAKVPLSPIEAHRFTSCHIITDVRGKWYIQTKPTYVWLPDKDERLPDQAKTKQGDKLGRLARILKSCCEWQVRQPIVWLPD